MGTAAYETYKSTHGKIGCILKSIETRNGPRYCEPLASSLLFLLFLSPSPFLKPLSSPTRMQASFSFESRAPSLDSSTCAQRHRQKTNQMRWAGRAPAGEISQPRPDSAWPRAAPPAPGLRTARTAARAPSGAPWKADPQGRSGRG